MIDVDHAIIDGDGHVVEPTPNRDPVAQVPAEAVPAHPGQSRVRPRIQALTVAARCWHPGVYTLQWLAHLHHAHR